MPASPDRTFIEVDGRSLHVLQINQAGVGAPLVFLHEGLGSVDLWRDFPAQIADRTNRPALIYSRYGNGWSTPLSGRRSPRYMHEEALETLPRILDLFTTQPPVLIGHSDGASIALIHAGAGNPVSGLVLIAPHVFVEPETISSIAAINDDFARSEMADRMAKYHRDPGTTFHGWADIWLDPAFRNWNIEEYLGGIGCPLLLIQGDADEYGTLSQIDAIERRAHGHASHLVVTGAGHSPHLSHPGDVSDAVVGFISGLGGESVHNDDPREPFRGD